MKHAGILSLLVMIEAGHAQTWHCKDGRHWIESSPVRVVLTANEDGQSASIRIDGAERAAWYREMGAYLRWDFGPSADRRFDYAFVLGSGGLGVAYDYSRWRTQAMVSFSQPFACRRIG